MKLLIATHNTGKWREYREIFKELPLELVSPNQEGIDLTVTETGKTFAENAVLKAQAYAKASGLLTLADDSGLEVDILGGEPGVYSARYGDGKDDATRYTLLLQKLSGVPFEQRGARFRCVIALVLPESIDRPFLVEGRCEGLIARQPRGESGFGYDPIFFVPVFGQTMAQLAPAIKNAISHRGQAAMRAKAILLEKVLGISAPAQPAPKHPLVTELAIRPARALDIEALATSLHLPQSADMKRTLEDAAVGEGLGLVAEWSGQIGGYLRGRWHGRVAHVETLIGAGDWPKAKVHQALLNVFTEAALERGARVLTIAIDPRDRRTFQKLGFVPYRLYDHAHGLPPGPTLFLKKSLPLEA